MSSAPECKQVILRIPAFEDVYPAGIKWIGRLHEVKAPSRLTGFGNAVRVCSKKGVAMGGIKDQAAGDDQDEPTLGG